MADNAQPMLRRACRRSFAFATVKKRHESAICSMLTGVDQRGTSRTCPAYGEDDRRNRAREMFRCIPGDHKGDADFIGARNVLTKTRAALGRVYCP